MTQNVEITYELNEHKSEVFISLKAYEQTIDAVWLLKTEGKMQKHPMLT